MIRRVHGRRDLCRFGLAVEFGFDDLAAIDRE
jgi:hypothetical protein